MDEIAISVKDVHKDFKLPHEKNTTLKNAFTSIVRNAFRRKTIETQHALKGISFDIKKGEFFGVVGRNGSGKSTLLKLLAGIYRPTKGTVITNGRVVPFIELGVGFNAELSGRENIFLNGAVLGFSREEINAKYEEIVSFAELENFMDQKLKNYSSGMQVRLAFSVATILADSDILLIDEVLAVGDASFQRKCFDYFSSLKKLNKTVVFVTHDMNAVRQYCDKAILIDSGVVVRSGKSNDVAIAYSKIFSDSSEDDRKKDQKRWGDKKVIYLSVGVNKKILTNNDKSICIECTARADEFIEDVVFGFSIKNGADQAILGTNTLIVSSKTNTMKPGELVRFSWEVPNVFSDGVHYVDTAIVYKGMSETSDWWQDSAKFRKILDAKTPYIISPAVNFKIGQTEQ